MQTTLALCFLLLGCTLAADVYRAIAVMTSTSKTAADQISGTVKFSHDTATNQTTVTVQISGIATNPDGLHGIHVHMFGDLRGRMSTAGANVTAGNSVSGHFNPYAAGHGCGDNATASPNWHAGDMGNWQATGGVINQTKVFTNQLSLVKGDENSIIGRAVVLHATWDDCAVVASAGGRLGYGVIGIQSVNTSQDVNRAGPSTDTPSATAAVCVLQGTSDCSGTCDVGETGLVYVTNSGSGIRVQAYVNGLTTERGFHIHDFGDLSVASGGSAGGHWNPYGATHGLPPNINRHAGDLGTISASQQNIAYYDNSVSISGQSWTVSEIIGRAIVVHEMLDHGLDPTCQNSSTYSAGAAGKRIYWCVLGIPNNITQTIPENALPNVSVPSGLTLPTSWNLIPCSVTGATTAPSTTSHSAVVISSILWVAFMLLAVAI